jgi:hypothetical protein
MVPLGSISQTNLPNADRHQHEVTAAKGAVRFQQHFCQLLLHILGYSFCTEHHTLAHFLPNAVAIKSSKNYLRKSCSSLALKSVGKIDPWCQFYQHFMSSFCTKILSPKITNPNCKHIKAAQKTFVQKSCS